MNVFVTKTGNKYHTHLGCVKMYNPEKISEEEAKKQGKTLCKNCKNGKIFKSNNQKNKKIYKKENLINDNDADEIIYNDSLFKNGDNSINDYLPGKKIDSNNNSKMFNNPELNNNFINHNENENSLNDINKDININNDEINDDTSEENEEEEKNIRKNINKKYLRSRKENPIAEKIQQDIEKDKVSSKNFNKKIESIPKKEIIEKVYNMIEDSKEDSLSRTLTNYKTISNNQISLCGIGDMAILEETYKQGFYVPLKKQNLLNENNNIELLKNMQKGKYIFNFEINNLKQDILIEIEVGYKIKYTNTLDLNFIDKNTIKDKKKNFKIGTNWDKIIMTKSLLIGSDAGKIYALMNIKEGKLFIIGINELNKRLKNVFLNKNNAEIFYIKNCGPIYYKEVTYIEPIFIIDKNDSKNCKIKYNGKVINSYF